MTSLILLGFLCLVSFGKSQEVGSIQAQLSISSLNHQLSLVIPTLLPLLLDNREIQLDISDSGLGFSVSITEIAIDEVTGPNPCSLKFADENSVTLLIENLNVSASLTGQVKVALMKGNLEYMSLQNLTIEVTLGIHDLDNGLWEVTEASFLGVQGLFLNTSSSTINSLIKESESVIINMVNTELQQLEQNISALVANFNKLIVNHDDFTFMLNLFGLQFNYTAPQAPTLSQTTGLFTLPVNGLFYDQAQATTHITDDLPESFPARRTQSEQNQFWVHQSAINSFILGLTNGQLPLSLTNQNLTNIFLMFMPEISQYFGSNMTLDLNVLIKFDDQEFIKIEEDEGLIIGDDNVFSFSVDLIGTSPSKGQETAASFTGFISLKANISLEEFVLYADLSDFQITGVTITTDNCGLYARNYDDLFTDLASMILNVVDAEILRKGIDLTKKIPALAMLATLFPKLEATPFYADDFLFLGISFFDDRPSQLVQ